MSLLLNEDQLMLKQSAKDFCREQAPINVLRKLRDNHDELGYDQAIWRQMVELGWTGMTFPESYGGYEFGYMGLGIVLEECGRTLVSSPLISSVLLCGTAINLGGSDKQKKNMLPELIAGNLIMALAIDELNHHAPTNISTRAIPEPDGYILTGKKTMVLDGHIASHFLVSCRTGEVTQGNDGISLLLVPADSPGVTVQRVHMVDSRNAAVVTFDGASVSKENLLGVEHEGFALLEQILDTGRIGLAAEMLGSIQEVFDRTIEYLRQREQFGVPIGSFQSLQHRAADIYCEIELCKSVVLAALAALDSDPDQVPSLASLAQAKLCEVYAAVSNEGIQMHGGIGMTDEFDIGFFLKRARVAQQFLGDEIYHRDRYATLNSF